MVCFKLKVAMSGNNLGGINQEMTEQEAHGPRTSPDRALAYNCYNICGPIFTG